MVDLFKSLSINLTSNDNISIRVQRRPYYLDTISAKSKSERGWANETDCLASLTNLFSLLDFVEILSLLVRFMDDDLNKSNIMGTCNFRTDDISSTGCFWCTQ